MDDFCPLEPLHFFSINLDIFFFKGKRGEPLSRIHLLPLMSSFFGGKTYAHVALGWNEEGIFIDVTSEERSSAIFFPNFQKGDSVELFFDTRDMKNAHGIQRFCHHFFFLPKVYEYEGEKVQCGEITRFRGDEKHDLADANQLFVICEEKRKGYVMHIFIPKEALFGYDPLNFPRIGFTYRINRSEGKPQYFVTSAEEYPIEKQPALWATLNLRQLLT